MLLSANVSKNVVRTLAYMYSHQRLCVRWDGALSEEFLCSNGVRQGSPLSPFLFNFFINNVLNEFKGVDIGCRVGGRNINILAYADDIVLLAPTWRGLQKLINKLHCLLGNVNMEINVVKTKCMVFPPKRAEARCLSSVPLFKMGDDEIAFCDECKYLGHILTVDLNDKKDVNREVRQLFARSNQLFFQFGACSADVKKTLWRSFINCFLWGGTVEFI
jgi:hypothetical protein